MGVYLAEFIGTMILIIFGNGAVANMILNKSKAKGGGWISITAGWGFGVAIAVYITGWVSGAHINPAVTIGLASIGNFSWALVPGYLIAQIIGAFTGSVLVFLSFKQHYDETDNPDLKLATFCTMPEISTPFWNVVTEFIATAILLIGILGITQTQNELAGMSAFMIGILVWALGLSLGGPTGYAINPARDFGPRIAHQLLPVPGKRDSGWNYFWIPIIAPITGGIAGAVIFKLCEMVWS
ncbi:MAG: MIP/aquaporin family protein [Fusobacteriota bacterium]